MSQAVGDFVRLTRLIRAPRKIVYNAWLDPAVRNQWWCASPEMKPGVCEIDPTVGGRYRVGMVGPDNSEYVVTGEFTELDPPNKLVFTWTWDHDPEFGGNSRVTIELFDATFKDEPATELLLTHERLTKPLERSDHTTGWLGCLKNLGKHFADLAEAKKTVK
tara:strand:+ start:861 stop:1346 length:486 start_codon:yes stop_codon:yes gene_type:complete